MNFIKKNVAQALACLGSSGCRLKPATQIKNYFIQSIFIGIIILFQGCYSFNGISIDYNKVKTFNVVNFENRARTVVPNLTITLTEELKDKIRNETRLVSSPQGDIEFLGTITRYEVSPLAPTEGENTASNRLDMTVSVEYINHTDTKENWKRNFSVNQDFLSTQNLIDVQDELIDLMSKEMIQDIVDKAFSNW